MPLILLCGYPSSGKTHRAQQIVSYLDQKLNNPGRASNHINGGVAQTDVTTAIEATANQLSEVNLRHAASKSSTASESVPSQDIPTEAATIEPSLPSTASPPTPHQTTSTPVPSQSDQPAKSAHLPRKIHYISDHILHIPRSAYLTAKAEKDARGAIYAAVKRVLTRNDIVVLDTGNYIKGWRYQLYCEAKNAGTASCIVHVGVPEDKCTEVNKARLKRLEKAQEPHESDEHSSSEVNTTPQTDIHSETVPQCDGAAEQDPYSPQLHQELRMRFEEPNAMNRWDSPLYTVPWSDAAPPCDQIWTEVILGIGKDGKAKTIRPNQATVLTPATSPSHLYNLERTTQAVIAAVQAHQQQQEGSSEGDIVKIPVESTGKAPTELELVLPATQLTFPHLQRLRRQFIALHRQQMGGMGMGGIGGGHGAIGMGISPERVTELFVGFLSERFAE